MINRDQLVSTLQESLKELNIDIGNDYEQISDLYNQNINVLREVKRKKENQCGIRTSFTGNSYWDVTDKYKCDLLRLDIPKNIYFIAIAVAYANYYLARLTNPFPAYVPTIFDHLFWQNIDYCIRALSSGWDRNALIIDLAYNLNTYTECNLKKVLSEGARIEQSYK